MTSTERNGTQTHREAADEDSRFLAVDGVEVHHKVVGTGDPTLLLYHHFYGNVLTWRKVMPHLAQIGTVAAFDRPGFGFTQRPPREGWNGSNPYTRAWSATAAARLLDHLGADRAVLVGASAGGTAAIETALRYPDRVEALVLISPAITGDVGAPGPLRPLLNRPGVLAVGERLVERLVGDITEDRVAGGWYDPSRVEPGDVEAYDRVFDVDGWARGYLEVMTAEQPPNLRGDLSRIGVPTLVISGDSDRTISPAATRRTASAIPGARFEVLPGCGHTPHEECPERLADVITAFVDGLHG